MIAMTSIPPKKEPTVTQLPAIFQVQILGNLVLLQIFLSSKHIS